MVARGVGSGHVASDFGARERVDVEWDDKKGMRKEMCRRARMSLLSAKCPTEHAPCEGAVRTRDPDF